MKIRGDALRTRPLLLASTLWPLFSACASHQPLYGCNAADGVTPICGFQNPEDLVSLADDWLLISQMRRSDAAGSLVAFRPSDGSRRVLWPNDETASTNATKAACEPPPPGQFGPHGIDLAQDGQTLLVVNHGGREAVERFRIGENADGPTLAWEDCVPFGDEVMLNDVASLPGGGFVVTEMVGSGTFAALGLVFGQNTGKVWHWTPEVGARPVPGSGARGPNGIAASADGTTLFIAEWGSSNLIRIGLDGGGRSSAALGFHPDNLSWTADGRILAGGQLVGPLEATSCFDVPEGGCSLGSAAAIIHPTTLLVERVWTQDPATVAGGISAALERGDTIWLGAYGGDRIARIPAP